jgi:hypothetical protein
LAYCFRRGAIFQIINQQLVIFIFSSKMKMPLVGITLEAREIRHLSRRAVEKIKNWATFVKNAVIIISKTYQRLSA